MARTHEEVGYPPKSKVKEPRGHTKEDWSVAGIVMTQAKLCPHFHA